MTGKYGIKFADIIDLCIFLIPISIICARLYYVLFEINYYIKEPLQIFNLRNGGLAIYGGIIGGAVTCYIYWKKKEIDILDLLDFIAPCLALRTSNRKLGKLHKCRSIRCTNKFTMENGNI